MFCWNDYKYKELKRFKHNFKKPFSVLQIKK
jgi:hypothetical protein